MKHILKINEYVEELVEKPMIRKAIEAPATAETMLKRIANRFNKLLNKRSNESLEDNLGLSRDFMDSLKGQFEPENLQGALQDNQDILRLLSNIRQVESEMSEQDKKEKAMEIVLDIFKGKGFDISKLNFKLDILGDNDLMDAKSNIIGISPEEFKEVKKEIESDNPKLKKEIDVRAIQNALTQGFATSIKDDFVTGDNEIEGVSFGDYYSLMNKTFGLYSKIPKELMHQVITQSPALGRVELVWNEDRKNYTIEAKGYTILILVHEMIKGILELISLHRDPKLEPEDEDKMMALSGTQFSERDGLQYGPGMVNKFKEFFLKVEDNLLKDREIQERNPAMMLNVLSRFYKLDDDLFLRVSKAIFSDDENKPYELFEEFYIDGLEGTGFRRRDDGPSNDPDDDTTPPSDDALGDLLRGAGISLNQDPFISETNKYIFGFNVYQILESKKDLLDKWSTTADRSAVIDYISKFDRITNNPKGDLKDILTSNIPGVNVNNDINDRKNIEKYNFPSLRALVDHISRIIKIPVVSDLKQGDINPAIATIQDALGLEKTGFYGSDLVSKIRQFQIVFKDSVADDYDWQEVYDKYKEVGITNLSAKEKIQLSKSAEFINTVEDIIKEKEQQLRNKTSQSEQEEDLKLRRSMNDEIITEYEKISNIRKELKTIKGILSGGLTKPSGKMDQATIGAITFDKGISKLEGLGDNGTLAPVGGEIVEDNQHYRITRVLGYKFCMNTRESFEQMLKENGARAGNYGWCISSSNSFYGSYRRNARKRQTIYFIENKKRAEYEAKKIAEYLTQTDSRSASLNNDYRLWRASNANPAVDTQTATNIARENQRTFYDNYHIAVLFVKDWKPGKNTFWLVGASNNGQWGDEPNRDGEHLTLKQCADKIWAPTQDASIRTEGNSTSGGGTVGKIAPQVTQEIIDLPFYYIPSDSELKNLEDNVILPQDVSSRERRESSDSTRDAARTLNINVSEFKSLNYDDKQRWLQLNWFTQDKITQFLRNRNTEGIKLEIWKVLPPALKELYIRQTVGSTLSREHLDEIENNPKLLKMYQDFIKRRLVGEGGKGGIIDQLKEVSVFNKLSNLILNNSDLDLISKPYNFTELQKGREESEAKLKDLPLDGKLSTRMAVLRDIQSRTIKIEQYKDLIKRYRESLGQAMDKVKRQDASSITSTRKTLEAFKDIENSIEYSKILQGANSRFDMNTKKKDDDGNALRFFKDVVEKDPGINKMFTDWKEAPNFFDKITKGLKSTEDDKVQKKLRNALVKLVHVLLVRSGIPANPETNADSYDKYTKQLDNAFNYIKNIDGDNKLAIKTLLTSVISYFKMFEHTRKLRSGQTKSIYKMYDNVLSKHPFLESRTGGFKRSSGILGSTDRSIEQRSTRTPHQEEL